MTVTDTVNRIFRNFKRYTGDGLAGEPTGAALPIGDPQSGVYSPTKAELRAAFIDILGTSEALVDDLLERYLGAHVDDAAATAAAGTPTAGQMYFNTTDGKFRVWTGVVWQDQDVTLNDGDVTEPKLATALAASMSPIVATRSDLQSLSTSRYVMGYLSHAQLYGMFAWKSGDQSAKLYNGAAVTTTAVNDTTNTFTKVAHGYVSMQPVLVSAAANGFTTNTVYWTIRVDADNFRLATSMANARAATAIDFTGTTNITVRRLKDPSQGVFVIPTGLALDGSQGCWERQTDRLDVRMMGAVGNNSTDDVEAFQHASNFGGFWHLETRSYRITQGVSYHQNGFGLVGQGMYRSVVNYTPTSGQAFFNPWYGTTTMVEGIVFRDLQLTAANVTASGASIIALKNVQRWTIERVYFYGAQTTGMYLVDARGIWPEGTYYGQAKACVFGLGAFGLSGSDGFNNNRIEDCRFQQAAPGGAQGITILPTVAGYSSVTIIDHCSFELPGNTMLGLYIGMVNGLTYDTCRFESLATAVTVLAGANRVEPRNSYIESCTTKRSNGSRAIRPVIQAAGTFNGVAGVAITGELFGGTVARASTGTYTVTFDHAFAIADYQTKVSLAGNFYWNISSGGQNTGYITFETRNRATDALADVGLINFEITGRET